MSPSDNAELALTLIFRAAPTGSRSPRRSQSAASKRWTVEGPFESYNSPEAVSISPEAVTDDQLSEEGSPSSPPITITFPAAWLGKRNTPPASPSPAASPKKSKGSPTPIPPLRITLPVTPKPTAPKKRKPMPLYKVVSTVIKQLIQLDKQSIFYDEVTDAIAPGYSKVIAYPMCFTRMRHKLKKRRYTTFDAAQMDLKLIFTNAMIYNQPGTIFHDAAKRMLDEARRLAEAYREKLDPAERGSSEPLFNDDPPVPLAPDSPRPAPAPAPVPKAALAASKDEPLFQTLVLPDLPPARPLAATKADTVETAKPKGTPRGGRKKKSEPPIAPAPLVTLPKTPLPLQAAPVAPVAQVITAPQIKPYFPLRRYVSVPRELVPAQHFVRPPQPERKLAVYFTFSATSGAPVAAPSGATGYHHLQRAYIRTQPAPAILRSPTTGKFEAPVGAAPRDKGPVVSPKDVRDLETFLAALGTPGDLSWHQRSATNQKQIEMELSAGVAPITALNVEQIEQLESLKALGVSLDFLGAAPAPEKSAELSREKEYELIAALCAKQQERLDHEPLQQEHYLADSLLGGLLTACGRLTPHELTSPGVLAAARHQLACTNTDK